jgi:hypothetical protein
MVLAAAEQQLWRETPYYYDTFNPVQTPWHPPSEKNIEEVFKRHEYFAVVYSDAGRQLVVSRYIKGQLADTSYWIRQVDSSLQTSAFSAKEVASRSLYLEHCASLPENIMFLTRLIALPAPVIDSLPWQQGGKVFNPGLDYTCSVRGVRLKT